MRKVSISLLALLLLVSLSSMPFLSPAAASVPDAAFTRICDLTLADTELGYELRGCAASPDGQYLYAGFLQNTRDVQKISVSSGEIADSYTPAISEVSNPVDRYPKGLAVDDRGNLFVGLTHAEAGDNHKITLAAVKEATMDEIGHVTEAVASSGTNVGVNGVAVVKTGDTYLCYMAVSYHNFSIRCYDVTDPENIVLYTDFAQNGVCQTAYTPFYLATDTQGNVYATGSANSVYYVTKIGPDGTQLKQIELAKAYSIVLCGGYLVVGDSQEGKITILDTNLSEVKKLTVDGLSGNLAQSAVGGGYIFLSDSGNGEEAGGLAGGFYRAPVSLVDYTKQEARKAETAPTVDGRLDEALWANRFFTHTDEASGKPMRFQFAWDTDNLYLAVRLADTTPFFSADKAFADDGKGDIYSFQYDCLEFYFSAANRVGAYGDGDVQFIFTCQDDGKPALRVGAGGSQREDYAAGKFDEVKSACTLTVTGWDFEAAIPWTALGVADLSATFGISLKQNDDFPEDSSLNQGTYISYGDTTWDTLTGKYTLIAKGAPAPGVNTSSTASPTTSSTSPSDDSSVTSTDGTSSVESAEGGGGSPHTGYESAVFPAVLLLGAGVAAALLAGRRSAKGR